MQDRVPRYPGRVTLTPVAGQANTYDLVRADQPTQAGTPLNKASLFSAETAAKYPAGTETVDGALGVLGAAPVYEEITVPLYIEHNRLLSKYAEGEIVYLKEGDTYAPFYIAAHDYESGLNGAGRTALVRVEPVSESIVWNSAGNNVYENSTVWNWLNATYLARLDAAVQIAVGTTKFYSAQGYGVYTILQRECAIFMPSVTELGISYLHAKSEGSAFRSAATMQLTAESYSSRSPSTNLTDRYCFISNAGAASQVYVGGSAKPRPMFTLPKDFIPRWFEDESGGIHEEQKYGIKPTLKTLLGDDIKWGVKIETGNYIGTGTYGESNPNTITFGFKPELILIIPSVGDTDGGSTKVLSGILQTVAGRGVSFNGSANYFFNVKLSENSVSWYGHSIPGQMNSELTYFFIAIG